MIAEICREGIGKLRHTTYMRTIAIALLAASALLCQDAKIIIVERSDTKELKAAYADYKAAQAKWEKVKTQVAKKYTVESGKVMDGWDKIEFSVDFRALVPQHQYISYSGYSWPANSVLTSGSGTLATTGNLVGNVSSDLAVSSDSVRADLTTKESGKTEQ